MLTVALARRLNTRIAGLTFDPASANGNVFVEFMPADPHTAVAVMTAPAQPQLSKLAYDLPAVQVLVRGERNDPVGSYAMARAIYDDLTCMDLVTLDPNGDDEIFVVACTAAQSDPVSMGQDANQCHEWSLNFGLHTRALTANRT